MISDGASLHESKHWHGELKALNAFAFLNECWSVVKNSVIFLISGTTFCSSPEFPEVPEDAQLLYNNALWLTPIVRVCHASIKFGALSDKVIMHLFVIEFSRDRFKRRGFEFAVVEIAPR